MFLSRELLVTSFFIAFLTMFAAIIIPEFFKVPYAFYNIIRILSFSSLAYIAYYLFKQKEIFLFFFIAMFTILYNPLMPIFLLRSIWMVIDVLIILTLIFSSYNLLKNKKSINQSEISQPDCRITEELKKLEEYYNTNCNNYSEKHKLIKLIGTTLGDFNEHFIEKLYCNANIVFLNYTVFESIKYLANNNHYNKDVINDLYSLNDIRNRIIHDKDRTLITKENIEYFLDMAKSSFKKADFLYKNLIK
jgi:hypothetical protein